jgi:hypothetical protein
LNLVAICRHKDRHLGFAFDTFRDNRYAELVREVYYPFHDRSRRLIVSI